ncbi:epoxide hydrolase family protein [Euzebya tangerina]|uniref:epoxide hydrolase family protein n=1 Tax=Euzebya tangerina TaxID=591198 RepID=UPI000E31C118|nr:epoxide hydrolase [Euzebya tangerina]
MNTEPNSIAPFTIDIADSALDDLTDRLARTRWPTPLAGDGWDRGVPVPYLRELAEYWRTGYDWRVHEARVAALPHFTTTVEAQPIHFVHVRSDQPDALPLLLTHGWPGSFLEFLDVIGPLTDPASHGGNPADAFDVVIPSMPGFGFSPAPTTPGWTSDRMAAAYAVLMDRLGYDHYGTQGGDFGAFIAPAVGRAAPDRVVGAHVNAATYGFIPWGPVDDDERATLSEVERARLDRLARWTDEGMGYFHLQNTKPQTLSYGLADSPVAQLAWMIEKFQAWTHPAPDLPEAAIERDTLLTHVTLYWLTNTGGTSAAAYYEDAHSGWEEADADQASDGEAGAVPLGVAVFAEDIAIRRYAEGSNPTITHWSDIDVGGHFAAMEVPDVFVDDVRTFFRELRPLT